MKAERLFLLTFIVTALYDVVLQLVARDMLPVLDFVRKSDWMCSLVPYFVRHTPLAAALIAGFVGYVTQMIIHALVGFPLIQNIPNMRTYVNFIVTSLAVSGLFGFIMKGSNLFPILDETYYARLGPQRAFITDAWSGLVVQTTLLMFNYFGLV